VCQPSQKTLHSVKKFIIFTFKFKIPTSSNLEYLREQGVDYPIDYRKEDFVEVIQRQNGDGGLDVIFDSIGRSYTCLISLGSIISSQRGNGSCYSILRWCYLRYFFNELNTPLIFLWSIILLRFCAEIL